MRTALICYLLLMAVLVIQAKSISLKKEHKSEVEDLETTLEDLRKTELTLHRGAAKDNYKETLKALTEEESDIASATGEVTPDEMYE